MKKIIFILLFFISNIFGESIYFKNTEYPSTVYTNQIFKIKVKATIVVDDYSEIETRFLNSKNIIHLNEDSEWEFKNQNEIYNTYIFKATDKDFILPTIELMLKDNFGSIKYSQRLKPVDINFMDIDIKDKLFSYVVAEDLVVTEQNTKQYSNNLLITVLRIDAKNSNIEDFKLDLYKEQGIDEYLENDDLKSIYYFVILPRDKRDFRFKYFNYKTKELKTVVVPIKMSDYLVSTQTNLNPKKSKLFFYQKIIISFFIILFLLFYFIFKRNINLILTFILIILLVILLLPNKKIKIQKNTRLYILPHKNSTVFMTTTSNIEAEYLKDTNGFKKVLLKNKKIGWIKQ
jgi:hypothetical protein